MKNKLISQLSTVLLTVFFSTTLIGQTSIKQEDIHIVLRNSISNEVKTFLNSDSVTDRNKENYISLTSGLNFFSYNSIPTNLKSAFLDPIAYGLDPLKGEYIRYASDSNAISNVLIFQIKDFERFKSKFANDEIVNFNAKKDIIELYNNTAFIKGNRLVYIFSEELNKRRMYEDSYVLKSNFVEAVESSFEHYCNDTEAADILATPLHLRQHPDHLDARIPTIEQIQLSRKYGISDGNYYYYRYDYANESDESEEENEIYGVKNNIFEYNEIFSSENDPLSFYKGYKRTKSYEGYKDSAAVEEYDMEEDYEYDYGVEEVEAVAADTTVAYEDYSYDYDEVEYNDPYENLSKKDQRKLKKLRAKEQRILAKVESKEYLEEEIDYVEYEEYESKSYQSFKYYKLCELYDNKRYVAPFLEDKFSITSDKKSYSDFKNSKAATAVWVNQESLIQVLYKDLIQEFRLNDKLSSNKNEYLKDCAMLFELDYTQKNKSIVTLKGYGNKSYLSDVKSVFDTKIPANWLANVPANAPVVTGLAIDNLKLTSFYKNIITQTFAASTDTIMKEWFNIVQAFLDEDAIGRIINGKTLFYVDDVVKFNKVYSSYEYDEDYNYTSVEKEKEVTYPRFAAFIGTDDKSVIQSGLNMFQYFGYLKEKNGVYTIYSRSSKYSENSERYNEHIYMSFINNALVISNDSILLKSIISNKKTNNVELSKTFEQNKVYMKVDFEKSVNLLTNTDFAKNNSDIKRLKNFEKMELTGLNFDENKFTLKLNFEQKATGGNQIKTVFDLFNF